MLFATLYTTLLLLPTSPGKARELMSSDPAYQKATAQEQTWEGWLDYLPGTGKIGLQPRTTTFRLVTIEEGKPTTRPLLLQGRDHLLALDVGKEVKIVGKLVATEAGNKKVEEIWPGTMEVMSNAGEYRQLKVIARTHSALLKLEQKPQPQVLVIRDGKALAELSNLTRPEGFTDEQIGKIATAQLLPQLNVPKIDWSKQMLVVISSGVQRRAPILGVQATKLNLHEDRLEIFWQTKPIAGNTNERRFGGSEFTQVPSETLLVARYDGKIKVIQEGTPNTVIDVPAVGEPEDKPEEKKPAGQKPKDN